MTYFPPFKHFTMYQDSETTASDGTHNPKNREEAFAFQFMADVKVLRTMAHHTKESYMKQLNVLKSHIQIYEQG